jgi:hypothetical protein
MCRIEVRVYIKTDGQSQKFEDSFPCHKSKQGKLCSNLKRNTTEYYPKFKPIIRDSRDGTTSPASYDPPTPDGSDSYLVQQHQPSIVERPPMRKVSRAVRPEIIIKFGSKKDKDRSKKYPAISVNNYKHASLGAASTNSNDFSIESPGSDASFTARTGLAETPVLLTNPYQSPPSGYCPGPKAIIRDHGYVKGDNENRAWHDDEKSSKYDYAKTVITVGSSSTYYSAVSGTESKRHIQSNRLQQ